MKRYSLTPQRNLDYLVLVFADYRLFGDNVGNIATDRFSDFLAMPKPVACRAVRALSVRPAVLTENALNHRRFQLSGTPLRRKAPTVHPLSSRQPTSPSTGCWQRT